VFTIGVAEVRDDLLLVEATCAETGADALSGLNALLAERSWADRTLNEWISVSVIVRDPEDVALFSTALSRMALDQALVTAKPLFGKTASVVIEAVGELAPRATSI
jgi:hypothetical protein